MLNWILNLEKERLAGTVIEFEGFEAKVSGSKSEGGVSRPAFYIKDHVFGIDQSAASHKQKILDAMTSPAKLTTDI